MKLNFKIDEDYFIRHTLFSTKDSRFSSKKHRGDIKAFQNYAWRKNKQCYGLLTGMEKGLIGVRLRAVSQKMPSFLNDLEKSRSYKRILKQAKNYLEFCKGQWGKNYPAASKCVEKTTGLRLNKTLTVYITHPSLHNGFYAGQNIIAWGHNENWSNYTTVYLWHEVLHSYFGKSDIDHTIIELITDNELRSRLNNVKYPPLEGHKSLLPLKKKILPHWRKYLKSEKKDIRKFAKKMNKIFGKIKVKWDY